MKKNTVLIVVLVLVVLVALSVAAYFMFKPKQETQTTTIKNATGGANILNSFGQVAPLLAQFL